MEISGGMQTTASFGYQCAGVGEGVSITVRLCIQMAE